MESALPRERASGVPRSDLVTTVAVAVTAYALCDLVHEAVSHGIAALMIPGVRFVSLSTVALQTTGDGRFVATGGSIATSWQERAFLGSFIAGTALRRPSISRGRAVR